MENKIFTFELTDNLGKHNLQSDRDCVWRCKECKTELTVTEESVISMKDKILPKCPKCGGNMKFHYWLDSLYTEEECRELEIISELKVKAIELCKEHSERIGIDLLRRYLGIGIIKANRILEALENDGIISKSVNGKRKLLKS